MAESRVGDEKNKEGCRNNKLLTLSGLRPRRMRANRRILQRKKHMDQLRWTVKNLAGTLVREEVNSATIRKRAEELDQIASSEVAKYQSMASSIEARSSMERMNEEG